MARRCFIAGNWKMNKSVTESLALVRELRNAVSQVRDRVEVAIAPPFTALHPVAKALEDSNILLAGQNCHASESGAFTGEIAAPMLKEVGCSYVILGHSERRQLFGETDAGVNRKVSAVLKAGMLPIVCVGETLEEREGAKTLSVVETQVKACLSGFGANDGARFVIAYEPVWAIGTGKTATSRQAQEVHAHIRSLLTGLWGADAAQQVRIQYGGSVKADNAAELLSQPDIDGALVGGASLKVADFAAIVKAKA
ncbi:MAG: triose-phosphate isomerase [Archangium sp.]|nr:triose-phosphate isomerase [Archangium sp.]MDP3152398.1 triose-phosphate isomerase [Archangium sp.]MDP3574049.1 triose-phosphate isomerase [Archangium sp.]